MCQLGFQPRNAQPPSSVLISSAPVTSHDLGPHWAGDGRPPWEGLAQVTPQISLLLGLGQARLLLSVGQVQLGMDGLPHVPQPFHPKAWLLGTSGSSKGEPTQPRASSGQEDRDQPSLSAWAARALLLGHNSHAADGPLGSRQSSDSYGSFKPPFLPNNPSSGAVLIPSCLKPLGMRGPVWVDESLRCDFHTAITRSDSSPPGRASHGAAP